MEAPLCTQNASLKGALEAPTLRAIYMYIYIHQMIGFQAYGT